jgi:hypothetical protein
MKAISGALALAEHLGCDVDTIRDHNYQMGQFTKPVYAIDSDDNKTEYWCPYKYKPKCVYDDFFTDCIELGYRWEKVTSSYNTQATFWKLTSVK